MHNGKTFIQPLIVGPHAIVSGFSHVMKPHAKQYNKLVKEHNRLVLLFNLTIKKDNNRAMQLADRIFNIRETLKKWKVDIHIAKTTDQSSLTATPITHAL